MTIAISVRPPQSVSSRRALPWLGALFAAFVAMPWAVRPLEYWLHPTVVARIGQGVEIAIGIVLAVWVLVLLRRQRRLAQHYTLELEQLTLSDPLTGLGNERAFTHDLDLALNRARRTRAPVAVLFFAVDDLDTLNARHGRAVGDRTLRMLGAVVRSSVRFGSDTGYRVGPDEFAMVVAADRDAAECVCRRLEWNFRERSPRHSQLSAGLALWDGRSSPHEALEQARRAQQSGRPAVPVAQLA